ncbi:hypothetical protein [Musicola paradisiaca]|uniref:hypothetical protein n=1 Tax=Musicola paradisiaca TaxID=69223 RepID=UPI0003C7FD32|nr:hypothetical protein [Musicola paradisiaca]
MAVRRLNAQALLRVKGPTPQIELDGMAGRNRQHGIGGVAVRVSFVPFTTIGLPIVLPLFLPWPRFFIKYL